MNEAIEPEIHKKIFKLIEKNPGMDINFIAEQINMGISQIEKYLVTMELKGEISSSHEESPKYYTKSRKKGHRQDRRTQETRLNIYNLVEKNPGLHLSDIAEKLDMSAQLADYHLVYMEKNNLIMSMKDGRSYYKRFYVKRSSVGVKEKQILTILRQKSLLKIVLLLINYSYPLKHKDILKLIDVQPAVLSYQLNKLVENDVVNVSFHGREKGYTLKNEEEITKIIVKYRLDKILDGFKDIWKDISLQDIWKDLNIG